VQQAVQVASPSPVWSLSELLAQGFDVAYSGLGRPTPSLILTTESTREHERPRATWVVFALRGTRQERRLGPKRVRPLVR
jgi:hypothetical protein